MRLGWYAPLVIVLWVSWSVGAGFYYGNAQYVSYLQADEHLRIACYSEAESALCRDPVWLADDGPWPTILNQLANQAVQATLWAVLAIIAYWAFRWIWAGRRRSEFPPQSE
jgi:hypothetical protein